MSNPLDDFDKEELERKLILESSFTTSSKADTSPEWEDRRNQLETEDFKILFRDFQDDPRSSEQKFEEYGWNLPLNEAHLHERAEKEDPKAQYILKMREFRRNYSIINYSGKTFVHSVDPDGELQFQDFKAFKEYHGSVWFEWEVEDAKGNPVKKKFFVANDFLRDKHITRYEGIKFSPGGDDPRFINLWKGWNLEGKPGQIEPFNELIRSLCNYEEPAYDYFMNYLAHLVQKPAEKPGVAIVMKSVPGVGKGTLMRLLSRFNDNYKHLSTGKSLTGDFSGHLMDGYIIFADESVWGGDKSAEGRLKSLITEPVVSIRAMRKDEIQVKSYCRLFVASNESWAVPVGEGDRRYFVVECSSKYKDKTAKGEFFWDFEEWVNAGGDEAVFYYLKHKDISKFNPRIFPKTKARTDMQKLSMTVSNRFIYELLNGTAPISEDTMTIDGLRRRFNRNKLYMDMVEWCKTHNRGYPPNSDTFGKAISESLNFAKDSPNWRQNWDKKVAGKHNYFYQINSMAEAQERFAKAVFDCPASDVFFNNSQHKGDVEDIEVLKEEQETQWLTNASFVEVPAEVASLDLVGSGKSFRPAELRTSTDTTISNEDGTTETE